MFEKILDEFEPLFGCFKINISINKFSVNNGKFRVEDKIKFYFWINVGGLTTASDSRGALHEVFNKYHFLKVLPKAINGFKLMNDHKEMLNHILPKIKNNNQKLLEIKEDSKEENDKEEKKIEELK